MVQDTVAALAFGRKALRNWLALQHIRLHAKKNHAALTLSGSAAYANLEFGLSNASLWQTGEGSYLGQYGILSLGRDAHFSLGGDSNVGQHWSVKMLCCEHGASISLGEHCQLEEGVELGTFGKGHIVIGDDCFIGKGSILCAHECITIGAETAIAEYVSIRDHNHDPCVDGPIHLSQMQVAPITIGQHVWIGAKVTIIAGVTIGDHVVIGANAVVTKDVPSGIRVAGVPARPIEECFSSIA